MCFDIVGVLYKEFRVDNRDKGFGGKVSGLFASQGL